MIRSIEDQLARDEGRVLKPYRDTKGFWTIGIGHYLGASIPPLFMGGITDTQCDQLFQADKHHTWDLLDVYAPWWIQLDGNSGPRSNVLVNMGFNLGVAGLAEFHTFLGYMQSQWWQKAADDLKTTSVYKQLPARYSRLCLQITTGQWQ